VPDLRQTREKAPAQPTGLGLPGAPSGGGGAGGRRGEPTDHHQGHKGRAAKAQGRQGGPSSRGEATAKSPGGRSHPKGPERSGGPSAPRGWSQPPRSPEGARAGGTRRPTLSPRDTRSEARATRAKRREPAAERMGARGCGGSEWPPRPQRSEAAGSARAAEPGGSEGGQPPAEPGAAKRRRAARPAGGGAGAGAPAQEAPGVAKKRRGAAPKGPQRGTSDPEAGPHTFDALVGGLPETRAAPWVGPEAQRGPRAPGRCPPLAEGSTVAKGEARSGRASLQA
jgi:hypothetical protein